MKTTLTIQESAELRAKGVSADKASEKERIYKPIAAQNGVVHNTFVNFAPIFTLADLLSLIPKEIEKIYSLEIYADNVGWDIVYGTYHEGYEPKHIATDTELVNALYTALLWTIDHNHVKLD